MIIPYKIFSDGGRLPFATLTIKGPKNSALVDAFVDSGADYSIFHAGWIKDLGLRKEDAAVKKIQVGDGDYIYAYLFTIQVAFYGHKFSAPIAFSKSLGPGFNLLGRKGFFEKYRFCFDDKHFVLSVTPLT